MFVQFLIHFSWPVTLFFVDLKSFVTAVLRIAYLTNYLGKYAIASYISFAVNANKVNK